MNTWKGDRFCAVALLFAASLFSLLMDRVIHLYFLEDFVTYERAARAFLAGRPLNVEYPFFSLLCFILPALFSDDPVRYGWFFFAQNFVLLSVFVWICFDFFDEIVDRQSARMGKLVLVASLLFFLPLVLSRYDIWVATLVIASVHVFLHRSGGTHLIACVLILLAGFMKIYAFLFLPIFLYTDFRLLQPRRFRGVVMAVLLSLVICVGIYVYRYQDTLFFLNYQYSRGIQIESVYSSVLLNLKSLQVIGDLVIGFDHGSFGVKGAAAQPLIWISTVLLLLLEGVLYAFYVINFKPFTKEKAVDFLTLTLLAFLITSKVLSTQFFIWLFPWIIVSLLNHKAKSTSMLYIYFLMLFLTFILFPLNFGATISGATKTNILLLMRNGLLVTLFITIFRCRMAKQPIVNSL